MKNLYSVYSTWVSIFSYFLFTALMNVFYARHRSKNPASLNRTFYMTYWKKVLASVFQRPPSMLLNFLFFIPKLKRPKQEIHSTWPQCEQSAAKQPHLTDSVQCREHGSALAAQKERRGGRLLSLKLRSVDYYIIYLAFTLKLVLMSFLMKRT